MIRVKYEYRCDFCRGEVAAPQVYHLSASNAVPQPAAVQTVGGYHACSHCTDIATEKLMEALRDEAA